MILKITETLHSDIKRKRDCFEFISPFWNLIFSVFNLLLKSCCVCWLLWIQCSRSKWNFYMVKSRMWVRLTVILSDPHPINGIRKGRNRISVATVNNRSKRCNYVYCRHLFILSYLFDFFLSTFSLLLFFFRHSLFYYFIFYIFLSFVDLFRQFV